MPRLPRASIEGVLYYVTCKAAQGLSLFRDDADYGTYLELLRKTNGEKRFKLFAYCLLDDHMHLLMELVNGGNISEIMQNLNTAYTKYYNSRYHRKGHVFRGRFKATYVEKDAHLLELTRHIHRNPCGTGLTGAPEEFRYSSCAAYVKAESAPAVDVNPNMEGEIREVLDGIPGEDKLAGYQKFLAKIDKERSRYLHKALHRGGFLGSEDFVEETKRRMEGNVEKKREEPRESVPEREVETKATERTLWRENTIWVTPLPGRTIAAAAGIIFLCLAAAGFYLYGGGWGLSGSSTVSRDNEHRMARLEERFELQQREIDLERKKARTNTKKNRNGAGTRTVGLGIPKIMDSSVWTIYLRPQSVKDSVRGYEDKLIFEDGKVRSVRLTSRGYPATNYSMRVPDDETIVWEAHQVMRNGDSITWRGDVRGRNMTGVMTRKSAKGNVEKFSFVSRNLEAWL